MADDVSVVEGTIRAVFREHIRREAKAYRIVTPRWLGIDELFLLWQSRCILANVEERNVVDLLDNRAQLIVVIWLQQIPNRDQIETVYKDMWQPYKLAVLEALPQAIIVVDKFHVVKMANQAVESIHKEVRESLSDRQRRTLIA